MKVKVFKTPEELGVAAAKQAVNADKQAKYRKIALHYGKGIEPNARFDVVEVYPDEIVPIPSAF